MTKAETDLGKKIAKESYVELTSKAKQDAAESLAQRGLVRIYGQGLRDAPVYAKAKTHAAKLEMSSW